MSTCRHEILTLVPAPAPRLRCRHCHLTITEKELGEGFCPECFAARKIKQRDFDKIAADEAAAVRYCCESCGMMVTV